nr:EAL domain-containing protein [Litorivivens lipolytica]
MEGSVATHRQELLHTIAELKETQEFNNALVNDSPLVIAAFRLNGQMIQLNDYGRKLAGWEKSDVENRSVVDLILPDPIGHTILDNLKPLISGRETRAQSEQLIRNEKGSVSYLTWIHAKVATRSEPMILSVGLDVTERRRTENRLRWLSKHDAITDLLNREAFHTEATQLIEQYRDTHTIELMMFDIDKFSSYNDMYGFQHGDNMLRETARFIERLIACHTIIGRTGTNEFSALLIIDEDDTTTAEKDKVFRVDGHALRFYSALENDAIEVNITAVVARHQEDGETVDDMLSNCAATLRALKPIDRGKVNYISSQVDNRAARQEKVQMHDSIVKALAEDRFVLYFQPIYNLDRNRITHCECLVRMQTEDGRILAPVSFLDIAKASGLMPRIDYLVLKMALMQLRVWADNNIHLKLSVNITADTFESDRFIKQLQQLLTDTGANSGQLIFEVVETEAINNLENAKALCKKLDALDVQIAFDDFGIGFTSFEYLRDLPVDFIKIDQSFIRYIYKRKSDQLLVKSMVDMAQALGKKVIAEGVEDQGSAELLREMGVHYLQGYYISKPCKASRLDLNYTLPTI